ncbi:MAG: hypothetical protein WCG80_09950 [Spirochaetales bacterium]
MKPNYSGNKRRRELDAKKKKEEKAQRKKERKELEKLYPEGIPAHLLGEEPADDDEDGAEGAEPTGSTPAAT